MEDLSAPPTTWGIELINDSTLTVFDISNWVDVMVVIGALETKSPRGSNEPVTMTSSITGMPALEDEVGVSSAKVELIEIKDASETISEKKRNFIVHCSNSKLKNCYVK